MLFWFFFNVIYNVVCIGVLLVFIERYFGLVLKLNSWFKNLKWLFCIVVLIVFFFFEVYI